nr:hypothetical protein [uncultured Paludibaculum sp.]
MGFAWFDGEFVEDGEEIDAGVEMARIARDGQEGSRGSPCFQQESLE